MAQVKTYPALCGYRKVSVLPEDMQHLLASLGRGLYLRSSLSSQLESFRAGLKELSPYAYRSAASDIREFTDLFHHPSRRGQFRWWQFFARARQIRSEDSRRKNFEHKLQNEKDLPYLLLFDGNGYNREAALSKIQGPLESPVEVIALADLANNWVQPVRNAALVAISRSFPKTSPNVLAAGFSFFAEYQTSWKRWDITAPQYVMAFFLRPDVIEALVERLTRGFEARGSRTLSHLLQTELVDPHLRRIFELSKDAAIRARALSTMLNRQAVWRTGYTWQWTNKSLGQKKRVPSLSTRKITIELPREPILMAALEDKSAWVRNVAAQAVVDHREELDLQIDDVVSRMLVDKSPGVRWRAEYLARKTQPTEPS